LPIPDSDKKKVLIINLGQVGDVIMSFPALVAIRNRFPSAELVATAGKTPAALIRDLHLVDRVITIDRYSLLLGPKLRSISQIFGIVRDVRREKFDLVVDLHSLYESNLLGYLSGAKHRLFANRRNRSLDFLSNVRPRPPLYDPSKHLAEIYVDVLQPLGVMNADLNVQISSPPELVAKFRSEFTKESGASLRSVGLLIGAGNPSRKWPLDNFVEIANRHREAGDQVFVFLGPEEKQEETSIRKGFGDLAIVVPDLTLIELAAAFSTMDLVIGNDTGTTHLAAASGPRVAMISDKRAPETFTALGNNSITVKTNVIEKISVDDVWSAVHLPHERTDEKEQPEKEQSDQWQEH
jgi:heptosyltransferase-1